MRRSLLIGLLLCGIVLSGCEVDHPPGVLAPEVPIQENLSRQGVIHHGDYRLQPIAEFALSARVLGKERYRFDRGAALAPYDLALGWGRMSDSAVLDEIRISQAWRWYRWRAKGHYPIPRREIEMSSANMHMVPADDLVRRALGRVREGDLVQITGKLIEVRGPDGFHWKSSLTRNDTGDGACELILVEDLLIVDREALHESLSGGGR